MTLAIGANATDLDAKPTAGVANANANAAPVDGQFAEFTERVGFELDGIDRLLAPTPDLEPAAPKERCAPEPGVPQSVTFDESFANSGEGFATEIIAFEFIAYERVRDARHELERAAARQAPKLRQARSAWQEQPPLSLPEHALAVGWSSGAAVPGRDFAFAAAVIADGPSVLRAPARLPAALYSWRSARGLAVRSLIEREYHALRQGYGAAGNRFASLQLPPAFLDSRPSYYHHSRASHCQGHRALAHSVSVFFAAALRPRTFLAILFDYPARRFSARRPSHDGAPFSGEFS